MNAPQKKQKPVCRQCQSDDVVADAYASWDNDAQEWAVANTYDKGAYCNTCEGETRLDWIES